GLGLQPAKIASTVSMPPGRSADPQVSSTATPLEHGVHEYHTPALSGAHTARPSLIAPALERAKDPPSAGTTSALAQELLGGGTSRSTEASAERPWLSAAWTGSESSPGAASPGIVTASEKIPSPATASPCAPPGPSSKSCALDGPPMPARFAV